MRIGVITFPGSLDDRDALRAVRLAGAEPVALWHGDHDLQGVDALVLGCTHYPLLSGVIQLVMGDAVTLVSSAEETAKDLLRVLTELDLLQPHPDRPGTASRVFEATGDPEAFTALAARFLGPVVTGVPTPSPK